MSLLESMFGSKYKLSDDFILFLSERFQSEFEGWNQLRLDAEREAQANKPLDLEAMAEEARKRLAFAIDVDTKEHLRQFNNMCRPYGLLSFGSAASTLSTDVKNNVVGPRSTLSYGNVPDLRYVLKEDIEDLYVTKQDHKWEIKQAYLTMSLFTFFLIYIVILVLRW